WVGPVVAGLQRVAVEAVDAQPGLPLQVALAVQEIKRGRLLGGVQLVGALVEGLALRADDEAVALERQLVAPEVVRRLAVALGRDRRPGALQLVSVRGAALRGRAGGRQGEAGGQDADMDDHGTSPYGAAVSGILSGGPSSRSAARTSRRKRAASGPCFL